MLDIFHNFLAIDFMGMTVGQLAGAFLAILLGFAGKRILTFIFKRMSGSADSERFQLYRAFLNSLSAPIGWTMVLVGVYVAIRILPLPREPVDIQHFMTSLFRGLSILLIAWFASRLSQEFFSNWSKVAEKTESKLDDQAIPIIRRSVKVFIYLIGLALFLQNMGYSVSSLLAGLGLGGAALALASKDSLSNLFGAIVIFLDRPFHIGDWIEVGEVEGTVEEIGLRTTRVRTFANSLITLPNSTLTTSSINNWSQMKKRRIKMTIGLTYDTSSEQMEQAVHAIRDIIKEDPNILDDFFLVNFDTFGSSSLEIFVYCFTRTTNWADFLDAKQAFLLRIMREMENLGLSFAFPTQTLHMANWPNGAARKTFDRPE